MTSRVNFGWKPTTIEIFVGIRHVGVNAPHHFSQKPPLKCCAIKMKFPYTFMIIRPVRIAPAIGMENLRFPPILLS